MAWDDLFEDLEIQLASEREAERDALDAESRRLRISRLTLHERLRALRGASVRLEIHGGAFLEASIHACGSDWLAIEHRHNGAVSIVPLEALVAVRSEQDALLRSLEGQDAASTVQDRMTLGFVLRDLARRRVPVTLALTSGSEVHGTIDRAGADHLDLAVHDSGDARRSSTVREFRMLPFAAIAMITLAEGRRAL